MAPTTIALRRLNQQRLASSPGATPDEVVAWLGAVQAQDFAGAKWALGLRMRNATDAAIERAFADGTILRTHVMRPTWHFVTPATIRWMLELTAARVNAVNAYVYRQVGLDDALFGRANAIIADALQGGQQLTRAQLGTTLAHAGIEAEGLRLGCLLQRAELDAVVCSGPRRGKQFTYMLLEERAPRTRTLARDEALAELTRLYFTGHGPATVRDFAWWSGLTVADAKAGLALAGSGLTKQELDGETYWFSESLPPPADPFSRAFLLPTYDEFLVGFAAFDRARRGARGADASPRFDSAIVIGGRVVGSWRRTFERGEVVVEVMPFGRLSSAEDAAIASATRRYGEFLGMPVVLRHG